MTIFGRMRMAVRFLVTKSSTGADTAKTAWQLALLSLVVPGSQTMAWTATILVSSFGPTSSTVDPASSAHMRGDPSGNGTVTRFRPPPTWKLGEDAVLALVTRAHGATGSETTYWPFSASSLGRYQPAEDGQSNGLRRSPATMRGVRTNPRAAV